MEILSTHDGSQHVACRNNNYRCLLNVVGRFADEWYCAKQRKARLKYESWLISYRNRRRGYPCSDILRYPQTLILRNRNRSLTHTHTHRVQARRCPVESSAAFDDAKSWATNKMIRRLFFFFSKPTSSSITRVQGPDLDSPKIWKMAFFVLKTPSNSETKCLCEQNLKIDSY